MRFCSTVVSLVIEAALQVASDRLSALGRADIRLGAYAMRFLLSRKGDR